MQIVPKPGPLAVYAGDPVCLELARGARCDVVPYDVGESSSSSADWIGIPVGQDAFELFIDRKSAGIWKTPLLGRHNALNTLAALIVSHRAAGVPLKELADALPGFKGVRRRQELVGTPGGVSVYDDFAHHPTAVKETLSALSKLHPRGRLIAAFEPRSATACRKLHQDRYVEAFDDAGSVIIAPVGRDLPDGEKLDTRLLAERISARGVPATSASSLDDVLDRIANWASPGDGVALLSNGGFGGLGRRILERLG